MSTTLISVLEFLNKLWGLGTGLPGYTLNRLAKSIPWNRFLGSLKVLKYGLSIQVSVFVDPYSSFEKKYF